MVETGEQVDILSLVLECLDCTVCRSSKCKLPVMVRFTDAKYKRKTRVRNTDTGVIRLYVGTNNREVADIVQKKKK